MLFETKPDDFKPGAACAICHMIWQDRVLYLKRHRNKVQGETWGVPGGKIDPGETVLEGLVREIHEETGIVVDPKKLVFEKQFYIRYPEFDFVSHVFSLELEEKPEVVLDLTEHTEYAWFTFPESLTKPLMLDQDLVVRLTYGKRLNLATATLAKKP